MSDSVHATKTLPARRDVAVGDTW
ncbi:MAG: hypothetical protein RLZZ111_2001, partial [Planctomycetota bacterium]